jgi:MFS family permease
MTSIDRSVPSERAPIPSVAWLSFSSAALAWLFDAMDLTIFLLVLYPSVSELIGSSDTGQVAAYGGLTLACKLLAWGLGGIAFGIVADRVGRARTMVVTVLIYSLFTGLSGLAQDFCQLVLLQSLAGVGIGGEWAAGAALVAETLPEHSRPRALLTMHMAFAGGFFLAGLLNVMIGPADWRWVFVAGASPALLALAIRWFVPEPTRWLALRRQQPPLPAAHLLRAIFAPDVRRNTIVGVLIAAGMMVGAWGTTSLLSTWIMQLVSPGDSGRAIAATGQAFMLANAGAVFAIFPLMWLNRALGRRWSYALVAAGCFATAVFTFTALDRLDALLWFMPLYGFFAIGGFATFAVYLPELFPTPIRATGQGFCWNAGRLLTALGPLTSGLLVERLGSVPMAATVLSSAYLVGLLAIWFGPETRHVPLGD